MRDEELRSSLRLFLEKTIDQDRKLNQTLRKFAHRSKDRDPTYNYLCVHMEQINVRGVLLEELLASLGAEETAVPPNPAGTLPIIAKLKEKKRAQRSPSAVPPATTRALDDFEKEVVCTYNQEPGAWSRKYRPLSFGAANVDEIWRSGGDAKFAVKEGGIYHLLANRGRFYVVPEPGIRLQDSYFRSEGVGQLFHCTALESSAPITLVSPAVVEESGERWVVIEKGELRGPR